MSDIAGILVLMIYIIQDFTVCKRRKITDFSSCKPKVKKRVILWFVESYPVSSGEFPPAKKAISASQSFLCLLKQQQLRATHPVSRKQEAASRSRGQLLC